MSSKISFIISMIFVLLFITLFMDMLSIQTAFSALDSKAITISYYISKRSNLDESFIQSIEESYHLSFTCLSNCSPLFGDVVTYQVSSPVKTILVQPNNFVISITREAIIGYYT